MEDTDSYLKREIVRENEFMSGKSETDREREKR